MDSKDIPSLAELFLLLPEHSRIIQGESKRIGVANEAASLKRALFLLSIALLIYLVFVTVSFIASPMRQLIDLILGLIPAIIVAIAIFLVDRRYRCLASLETKGILLSGRVVAVRGDNAVTSTGVKTALRLRYEFISPQGKRLEREEAQLRDDIKELPALGTPVAIMYVSDSCFRVL